MPANNAIPASIRALFSPRDITFAGIDLHGRDVCALLLAGGEEKPRVCRRDDLQNYSASPAHSDPVYATARQALADAIQRDVKFELTRKDLPQIAHVELLQYDMVRVTFHEVDARLNKQANGHILLTTELKGLLKNAKPELDYNSENLGLKMRSATLHNIFIFTSVAEGRIPEDNRYRRFVSETFESSPPKLQNL
ncbi:MAG: hypothetical protein JWO78_2412 [Micavibrio sp.]|nr:hypothetical protein [Micavibrio sp.]